jgi:hypothetical protein
MTLTTQLTDRLGIRRPVLLAPIDLIAGGLLAAAVSGAGGLGLIGGDISKKESRGFPASFSQHAFLPPIDAFRLDLSPGCFQSFLHRHALLDTAQFGQ